MEAAADQAVVALEAITGQAAASVAVVVVEEVLTTTNLMQEVADIVDSAVIRKVVDR